MSQLLYHFVLCSYLSQEITEPLKRPTVGSENCKSLQKRRKITSLKLMQIQSLNSCYLDSIKPEEQQITKSFNLELCLLLHLQPYPEAISSQDLSPSTSFSRYVLHRIQRHINSPQTDGLPGYVFLSTWAGKTQLHGAVLYKRFPKYFAAFHL